MMCLVMQEDFNGTTTRGAHTGGRLGHTRGTMMGGKMDQMKGRVKEAVGVLADDDSLKSEGKLDQVVGKVKEHVERVKGKLEQAVEHMKAALAGKRPRRPVK
jgi:uncharacterized protein YjbJ (UPF0337 family)